MINRDLVKNGKPYEAMFVKLLPTRFTSNMKTGLFCALFAGLCAVTSMGADLTGTWKLNPSKSTIKTEYSSDVITIERIDDRSYRFIYDLTLQDGRKVHSQTVRTFDSKPRAVEGREELSETNEHPDDSTWISTRMKDGVIVDQRRAIISQDNKTQTVYRKSRSANGQVDEGMLVFDKQ